MMAFLALAIAMCCAVGGVTVAAVLPYRLARRRRRALHAFSSAVSAHTAGDPGEVAQLADMCKSIGRKLKLSPKQLGDLEAASHLCNIGLAASPYSYLAAGTEPEHAVAGAEMVSQMPSHAHLAEVVRYHDSAYSGGAPGQPSGVNLPIESRIICAAEGFLKDGFETVRAGSGTRYCPLVVEAIESVLTSGRGRHARRAD